MVLEMEMALEMEMVGNTNRNTLLDWANRFVVS